MKVPSALHVRIFAALLLASALVMAWVGSAAAGYYVPALTLFVLAALVWFERLARVVQAVAVINVISGLALILDLWLGEGLGDLKLDISAVMLLANLACGGPLLSLFAVPLVTWLRTGKAAPAWLAAHFAKP